MPVQHGLFYSCSSLKVVESLCGIFYFLWHGHQTEGTDGFMRLLRKNSYCVYPLFVELGSSAVECQTHSHVSPGSSPLCYRFLGIIDLGIFVLSTTPSSLSYINNEYLAIDSDGNVSE